VQFCERRGGFSSEFVCARINIDRANTGAVSPIWMKGLTGIYLPAFVPIFAVFPSAVYVN
jgi:hypothetical protein